MRERDHARFGIWDARSFPFWFWVSVSLLGVLGVCPSLHTYLSIGLLGTVPIESQLTSTLGSASFPISKSKS